MEAQLLSYDELLKIARSDYLEHRGKKLSVKLLVAGTGYGLGTFYLGYDPVTVEVEEINDAEITDYFKYYDDEGGVVDTLWPVRLLQSSKQFDELKEEENIDGGLYVYGPSFYANGDIERHSDEWTMVV